MASRAARDLGLARIGTTTRWMLAATLVGGGVLSAAVARALPGRSSHSAVPGATATPGATALPGATSSPSGQGGDLPAGSDGGALNGGAGLSAPAQTPQPTQSAPVVNSGGS